VAAEVSVVVVEVLTVATEVSVVVVEVSMVAATEVEQ
jgi:hypothetical protein